MIGEKSAWASTPVLERSGTGSRERMQVKRALGTRLRRIAHTGPAGMADRGRQELQRFADRIVLAAAPGLTRLPAPFRHLRPRPAAPRNRFVVQRESSAAHGRAVRREYADRFFAGAGETGTADLVASRFPAMRESILARAGESRAHIFTLMGHKLNLGPAPVDWHRDAVSGRRARAVHWSRLDPLDYGSVGDSKITWELSRHQWLIDLAQAYRLSGREDCAESAMRELEAWMHANPPGIGINWASSLEVAFRLIAWCWILSLLRDSRALTPERYERVCGWIEAHAGHVEKYLSRYFSPNTHLTGEALGLVYAGTLFPELTRSAHWRSKGARVLLRQLPRQVLPDGVYFEQSTCYARYTAEIYLHFFILAQRNGIEIPAAARERLCRLLDYLLAIRFPDGSLPRIGDADGGRLLPLAPRSPADCRDVFAVAAVLFGRNDYAWAAGGPAPEVAWLLGADGCERFERLDAAPPDGNASKLFAHAGWAVMRSGWERDAHQLVFDVGPLGCSFSGGHGHADLLGIQCASFGEARLGDAGTYCYTAEPPWRDYFRGSRAHSTLLVDDRDQAVTAGCFSWVERTEARLNKWISTADYDYADAEHDAYAGLAHPVRHRRRILFVKPRYWIIVDDLAGTARHRFDLMFQFEPLEVQLDADGWARCPGADGRGLCLRSWTTEGIESRIATGELDPPAGWISPDYGIRVPAPQLHSRGEADLPARLMTLLLPASCAHTALPEAVYTDGVLQLDFSGGRETVTATDTNLFVESASGWRLGAIGRDGGANPCAA
ncbi:MAG: heparinase II/III family protein [Gammaproteobacteria bacterium]|nr:heparinase II/III family protein [Gammaproteobacteria bacterium]